MSNSCHRCGPVKHEAPTYLCVPCAIAEECGIDDDLAKMARYRILVSDETFDAVTEAIRNPGKPTAELVALFMKVKAEQKP